MNSDFSLLIDEPIFGVASFALATVVVALGCYASMRAIAGSRIGADSQSYATAMIGRLGTLHALILSLMFAQEMIAYMDLSRVIARETSAIGDVYLNAKDYDSKNPQSTAAIRDQLANYVQAVLQDERSAYTDVDLSRQVWRYYRAVTGTLRNLKPANDDQKHLREQMLADWDAVSEHRLQNEAAAAFSMPHFFWLVAVSGFFAVVIPSYVYSPNLANLITLSVFAAFNGIVLYVVFAVSDPFSGPGAIAPTQLKNLLATMTGTAR